MTDSHAIARIAAALSASPDREARAAGCLAQVRAQWPNYTGTLDAFAEHLCDKIGHGEPASLALKRLHVHDLFLAWGVAAQEPGFADALLQRYGSDLDGVLRKIGLNKSELEDAKQVMLEKVMVATSTPATICNYAGRGPLGGWLRTAAVRIGLAHAQHRNKEEHSDALDRIATTGRDPELALLREKYSGAFALALQEALAALGVRERNLLRQHYLDGLSSSELGILYKVHKATAARWVVAAREAVAGDVQRRLREHLQVGTSEIESLARLVQSDLDLSLGGLLASAAE